MIQVSSSAILAVGYDAVTRRMKITFAEGKTYDFCGVPEGIFKGLLHAGSKGRYYNDHIRYRYQC
ncbi:KTSC domain-containing protein [Billgrantia bachuensis]